MNSFKVGVLVLICCNVYHTHCVVQNRTTTAATAPTKKSCDYILLAFLCEGMKGLIDVSKHGWHFIRTA